MLLLPGGTDAHDAMVKGKTQMPKACAQRQLFLPVTTPPFLVPPPDGFGRVAGDVNLKDSRSMHYREDSRY